MTSRKIYFLQSHAIQYHSPLYDLFTQQENIEFKVLYCSGYGLEASGKRYHPEFGELPNWDVNLVNGHPHEILKNHAFRKGIFNGFFGLVNFGIYKKLKRERPDVLVILGWNYFSLVYALFCCKLLKIKVYVRGDNTLDFDKGMSALKKRIKRFYFGKILFPLYTKIGFVGEKNKAYFKYYGVQEHKLIHLPHAIDNKRFREFFESNHQHKTEIKSELGLSADYNIMFFGRLNKIKCIHDIINALPFLRGSIELILVGDGIEKESLMLYAKEKKINTVKVTGFKNQNEIMKYYLCADTIILSSKTETWGLVINEALNFNLPAIVSSGVGCSLDLARKENGFIFPVSDSVKLAEYIQFLYNNPEKSREMGEASGKIIKEYSYKVIIENLLKSIK